MDYLDSHNWPAIIVAGLGTVAAFYLLIPWLIFATQRMTGDPKIVLFDPEKSPPPETVARYLEETGETLLGLGFEPQPCIALPDPMPNVRSISQLWIHPQRRDAALISAIFASNQGGGNSMQTYYAEFLSRFESEDVSLIQTNNADMVNAFAEIPGELTFRFPMVKLLSRLDRLHRRLVELHAPSGRKFVSLTDRHHGDMSAYIRGVLVDSYRQQEGTGYLVYDEARNSWRPTVKGAYLMTWSQLWPMSMILKTRIHARARQLLRDFNDGEE